MATPESKVKAQIKLGLADVKEAYPGRVKWDMIVPCGMGGNGIPDFVGTIYGRSFAIEAKAAKGEMTKLQELWRDEFILAGGMYVLARPDSQERDDLQAMRAMVNITLTWLYNNPSNFQGRFLHPDQFKGMMSC